MKSLQSDVTKRQFSAIVFSSLVLGLLFVPLGYISIGALKQFPAWFQISSLPLVVLGIGALCFRYIGNWAWPRKRVLQILVDLACWALVVTFLYFVSLFTLMTQAERLGFFLLMHLIFSGIALCLLLMIRTPLEIRLENLPVSLKAPVVLAVVVGLVIGSIWFMVIPSKFI